MRVVIDLQGAQAENRTRGIGRYALSFTKAFIKHRREIEVFVVLNGAFGDSIDEVREALFGLLPDSHIHIWTPNANVAALKHEHLWARQASELVREAFIASLDPDLVLITSVFEGLVDDAVTSIKRLTSTIPTAAIVYDLIPLINPEAYLAAPPVRQWYESKLKHLRRADLVLAISNSSRSEVIRHLGFSADEVINVSTAIDTEHYRPVFNEQQATDLLCRLGINREFVMYTGGIDPRKNIDGLIIAYSNLPAPVREQHQLVIVCKVQPEERVRLESLAKANSLKKSDVCFTGYVSDADLLTLYNACKLFIFPSLHEGFGLPALEAMSCGKPVIASNTSSLPEVLGNPEALFDPFDTHSITTKLEAVLTNKDLRTRLAESAIAQAATFSWDQTAIIAVAAVHKVILQQRATTFVAPPPRQLRLAYVSPLPPARSGISDYSAELLPELAAHYQIDVIVAQDSVSPLDAGINYTLRSVAWFEANAHLFDRVIYHFGNSTFHDHMFHLIEKIPGTVVLHDFFLSGVVANMEVHQGRAGFWTQALYHGHGYQAVAERINGNDTADAVWKYSCNLRVLQQAEGIIVHSHYSIRLAQQWYGENSGLKWAEIPLLRTPRYPDARKRAEARSKLGFSEKDFVVCSYGLLGPSKLNDRLLEAWFDSELSDDSNCHLIYVGQNSEGAFGESLLKRINTSACRERIKITGWADTDTFKSYLEAADAAVQLRTLSRGETSAAVLDCLNYGIATIVNANGSMSDIPDSSLIKLPDTFTNAELSQALTLLRNDPVARQRIGGVGQELIHTLHSPRACAARYQQAIENFHKDSFHSMGEVVSSIASLEKTTFTLEDSISVATSIDQNLKPSLSKPQLLVDISELVNRDAKSGIQRVVRNILQIWLKNPPGNYRVEPVYATENEEGYRYARHFTLGFIGCPRDILLDEPVVYHNGDHFIGLDLQPVIVPRQQSALAHMRRRGVKVQFVVYDLLLKKLSHCFPDGASDVVDRWLETVSQADGAICISKAVADEMAEWLSTHRKPSKRPYTLSWFHLGADINEARDANARISASKPALSHLGSRTSFLMVGTIEPRKAHAQVLDAFEVLWANRQNVNLLIVGKQGWMVEALVERLNNHPEKGKRLFWFEGIDDEYLCALYEHSDALIAASLGEGFGLPLIEAAQYRLPLIVRDIPVFREVAGAHAYYFNADHATDLSSHLVAWLDLHAKEAHPKSAGMPWLTWDESAQQLFNASQGLTG
ncbi:glycosyltransferase [Pseudomonas mosselii]|uniref:glycosyltransferase n=1 Tax=Pseudomonas mosselii TaxID=78327 RepID=UPI000D9D8D23|nr:glycosyltransferase [Pseudomonas mosselii]PYC22946.1 glycosyl transferase family 1 [Pseudomonas mosselii]